MHYVVRKVKNVSTICQGLSLLCICIIYLSVAFGCWLVNYQFHLA